MTERRYSGLADELSQMDAELRRRWRILLDCEARQENEHRRVEGRRLLLWDDIHEQWVEPPDDPWDRQWRREEQA